MDDPEGNFKAKGDSFPWYKRDARAFYEGTRRLSLEARGAYSDIIDLMMIHDGPIPDDPKWMSHALYVSVRKWKAVRSELIEAAKIEIVGDTITNSRALFELEKRTSQRRVNRENSVKHSRKNNENPEKANEINETTEQIGPVREELELEKKRREKEEERKENDRSFLSIEKLDEEIWSASAGRMMDDLDDPSGLIRSWRREGATDDDIVETIREVAAAKREESIEHFGYFSPAVREAIADRKAGRKNRHVPEKPMTQAEWLTMKRAEQAVKDLAEAEAHGTA